MSYCDDCASEYCTGHEWCEECGEEICNECGGCDCDDSYCPGYVVHQTGQPD
ncbi:hypothetical protein AB0O82_03885 [Kitasatospora sp. NPDC088264]|uniref:hypothetical protein n=1 Tax=Kitasatospora sp. NPDC088264 TaxID=3155296 RepID=UPI00344A21E1